MASPYGCLVRYHIKMHMSPLFSTLSFSYGTLLIQLLMLTQNKRIILNICATYGRNLFSLICGLFSGRWALLSLGSSDYGLLGVVGGLTGFVTFINGILAYSVIRFYGISVGESQRIGNEEEGLEECRKWFNAALIMHLIVAIILIIIGYPIGCWAVRNFLTIPGRKVTDCLWIWRTSCLTCFVGMISVPFISMYEAKQEIAEQTLYSFVSTCLNFFFLYYMVTHPGDWLLKYAIWMCLLAICPLLIMMTRAYFCFPECKICINYFNCLERIKKLVYFGASRLWTALSSIWGNQGQAVIVNKFYGSAYNATVNIANTVARHTLSLSTSLAGAFWPALNNAAGRGEKEMVTDIAFRTCKFGTILVLLFALPLMLEIDEVMKIWLKEPPIMVAELCLCIITAEIINKLTDGCWMPIMAYGKYVAKYSFLVGWGSIITFMLSLWWLSSGYSFVYLGIARIIGCIYVAIIRLYFSHKYGNMPFQRWIKEVFVPITIVSIISWAISIAPRIFILVSIIRVFITTLICELFFFVLTLLFCLTRREKNYLFVQVKNVLQKMKRFFVCH